MPFKAHKEASSLPGEVWAPAASHRAVVSSGRKNVASHQFCTYSSVCRQSEIVVIYAKQSPHNEIAIKDSVDFIYTGKGHISLLLQGSAGNVGSG